MQRFFYNQPLFRIIWPPIYGFFVYLLILLLNNNLSQLDESFFGQELYFCIGLSFLVFEGMRLLISIAFRREEQEPGPVSTLNIILLNLLVTSIVVVIGVNLYFRFVLGFSSWSTFSAELGSFLAVYLFSALFYTSIAISASYLYRKNKSQLQQEQILRDNLELELIKFKNEINPDLLYDSLESLIPLIHKNAEEAEDYIDKMALVYRHILNSRNSELIELGLELKAVRNIVSLLNEKHHRNIKLNEDLDDRVNDQLVIPGSLSSVIEKITRNTIISDHQPLKIQLEITNEGYLVISHTMNEKLRPGLLNNHESLQRAYSIFTEKPVVSVKAYGENFVKIPLLQLEEEPT